MWATITLKCSLTGLISKNAEAARGGIGRFISKTYPDPGEAQWADDDGLPAAKRDLSRTRTYSRARPPRGDEFLHVRGD
jgi:hypothetical protein